MSLTEQSCRKNYISDIGSQCCNAEIPSTDVGFRRILGKIQKHNQIFAVDLREFWASFPAGRWGLAREARGASRPVGIEISKRESSSDLHEPRSSDGCWRVRSRHRYDPSPSFLSYPTPGRDVPASRPERGRDSISAAWKRELPLFVLRAHSGLTGVKSGCGAERCGACTKIMDGVPTRSFIAPAADVERAGGRRIEGLAEGDRLHPVQAACAVLRAGRPIWTPRQMPDSWV
jgi:hypothetical protein